MKHTHYALMIIGLFLGSCTSKPAPLPRTEDLSQVKSETLLDQKYGQHERNKMDIYLPAGRNASTPFVIHIHGGAWTMGDKKQDTELAKYLADQGIAVANIDYRYATDTDTHLPQMLDDISQIEKYLAAHAKAWHTRARDFTMSGVSSGSHIAMMYSYTRNSGIKAIAESCGPTDFTDRETIDYTRSNGLIAVINKMTGYPKVPQSDELPEIYAKTSPAKNVKNIPILIIHGDKDQVVPVKQAHLLDQALSRKNITHRLTIIPGADHFLTKKPQDKEFIYHLISDWIKKYGI